MKRTFLFATAIVVSFLTPWARSADPLELKLPNTKGSFRFAVIGDTGTGDQRQRDVGAMLERYREATEFETVVMMGDNLYGGESPKDFRDKFEVPYAPLLSKGVKFYATLGNHDNPNQSSYEKFNMKGQRYYTFRPRDGIRFFVLDSTYLDKKELDWLEKELSVSGSEWKIAYFHHPLYSSGETHGSAIEIRKVLEPLFLKYGVSLVLSGHEHFYERIKPQKGIQYFVVGGSAKVRKGDIQKTDLTAKGYDSDNSFMLCEIDKDTLYFQAISRTGITIDSGSFERVDAPKAQSAAQ
ncbi:MAG: metallophosphoesterase [Acidobacteriota bacterium]